MANEISRPAQGMSFTQFIQTSTIQDTISKVLTDPKRAMSFVAAITSAISVNPVLKNECDPKSVLNAALLGEALSLSPSPQLGQYYMVPFDNKKENCKQAQFIIGFKGLLQLAIRSGQFRHIMAIEIKEGELKSFDPIHDKIECVVITDPNKRSLAKTIGYYGYFELLNGFEKAIYMPMSEMEHHADTYSKAFSLKIYRQIQQGKIDQKDMWKYSSFWYKDFDTMAKKTILRRMLSSGYAPLSVEMSRAIEADDKQINRHEDGTEDYAEVTEEKVSAAKDVSESEPEAQAEVPFDDPFEGIQESASEPDFGNQIDLAGL